MNPLIWFRKWEMKGNEKEKEKVGQVYSLVYQSLWKSQFIFLIILELYF